MKLICTLEIEVDDKDIAFFDITPQSIRCAIEERFEDMMIDIADLTHWDETNHLWGTVEAAVAVEK